MASTRIDVDRLWRSIETLGEVGAYEDANAELVGVNRLALSDADRDARRLVARWFKEAGLAVRTDAIGNTYGRREGTSIDAAAVMSGSHIDSVPTGGRFDGALGVLGALEVVRALNDAGVTTRRPIEIGFFSDEEGARFGCDMLGSATACGRIDLDDALALRDSAGVSVADELSRIGFRGEAAVVLAAPHAFVECHIEQGPVLASRDIELGVVTQVQAISWREVTLRGKSAHAGTTPMELRRDAGHAVAQIQMALSEMIDSGHFGPGMRATVGRIELEPNLVNVVPGRARCTIDLRNPSDEAMDRAMAEVDTRLAAIAERAGVEVTWRQTARTPSVPFDDRLRAIISRHMLAAGIRHEDILSGAGHDAQEFAAVCPSAMIFVPGLYDGISHNPREYSTPEACGAGIQMLLDTLVTLANED
jgi:N-carbamoyl-L-amino-acid hydrolase